MEFIQEANNFPAWNVIDADGSKIGLVTNFRGEGFAITIKADFTFDEPRTLTEPRIKSLDDFRSVVALWLINLKDEYALVGGEKEGGWVYLFDPHPEGRING